MNQTIAGTNGHRPPTIPDEQVVKGKIQIFAIKADSMHRMIILELINDELTLYFSQNSLHE